MRRFYSIIALFLMFISCKAQAPLYLAEKDSGNYYKDIDNDLNKFEGTWLLTNDTLTFKIVLQKKTHILNPYRNFYSDIIIGEYQHIENGIQQVNSIPNINSNSTPYENNTIYGDLIRRCDECLPGQRNVILLSFFDPVLSNRSMRMSVRHFIENGVEKIRVGLRQDVQFYTDNQIPVVPTNYLPITQGNYILIKTM